MTTFDEREDAFERRFARDAALGFQARAQRTHRIGLRTAGCLGQQPGEAVQHKVVDDLAAAGLARSEVEVRPHMEALLTEAEREVRAS